MGVRRGPSRAVSLDDARNPESVADATFLAQLMAGRRDEGWLNPSQERSLRTAGEVVRPMQLRDLGIAGLMGMVPLPFPGGKAGRTVAGGVAKGVGKMDDAARGLVNFLRRGDDVVDDVADLVQPTLPGTSAAEMQHAVNKAGLDTARGSLRWTPELGVPRAGKPGLGGSGAPAADARPLFRTERPAGSTLFEDMGAGQRPPAGSNYYDNADGTVSRFKTQNTSSQTLKPDQWGWMDPGEYRYVNEEAAAAIRRQMGANAPATVKWEWNAAGDQLKLVDIATGKSIGAVYDAPRVGLQPFASWPDGRTHLGDRIAEVFQPRGRHRR